MRRRTTNNRGGAQAVWLGRLPLLYERGAIIARLLRWPACTLDPQLVTDCGMRVTVEHYQRDALTSHAQATRHRCGSGPSSCRISATLTASLGALAAADALAGAGRALRRLTRMLRVLAAAAATRTAIRSTPLTGVQRAIPVLGPARPRAAR